MLELVFQIGFACPVFRVDHDHAAVVSGVVHDHHDHVVGEGHEVGIVGFGGYDKGVPGHEELK